MLVVKIAFIVLIHNKWGDKNMNYKVIDMEKYYRKGVFNHFSQDCKCSVSITNKIDV
ncbi:Chloramphenicol O-acetyltransferase, partial [human gut metagenome]